MKNNQSASLPESFLNLDRRRLFGAAGALLGGLAMQKAWAQPPANGAELDARYFPGFRTQWIEVNDVGIHTLVGGEGPPVLLLHGAPQSHLSWAEVATTLAQNYTVVATDLRGYGWSSKPEGGENHINYSKRTMARDQAEVMRQLGFERFHLVGHDRGGRVARRLTLDYPEMVQTLTVLDIVPAHYLYANVTREFVDAYFHWFLFLRPAPFPENIIASTGMFIGGGPGDIGQAWAEVYKDPAAIHAMCEDYRASANMDIEIDKADLAAGKRIECPLNVLWGSNAAMGRQYDVLGIWQQEATRAEGKAIPGGHSFQMDSPAETAAELLRFFAANA
jgi:Predicted hydrolases or acyltransferases (alpha/beta hydrolase superfamily)